MNFAALTALSPSVESAVRIAYAGLLILQLIASAPNIVRFFCSERYGGYVESTPWRDRLHRPAVIFPLFALWVICACAILFDVALLPAAAVNFAFARYFYVHMRWKSIARGMGAPGHMNHWLAALILFLATTETFDSSGLLRAVTVLTFRVDFAAIMIAAGVYKIAAGYARGDGFERGLVNPWWGFHATWLRRIPAHSPMFSALNHAGYIAEILCGACFLIPAAAPYAALLLGASFLFIGLLIRLTWLAEMVAVCCVLMIPPGNAVNALFERLIRPEVIAPHSIALVGPLITYALTALLGLYLVMLPVAYAGMIWNLYFKRRLPDAAQRALDVWTGFFGLILWRVFTADVINFFASIEVREPGKPHGDPYLSAWAPRRHVRYRHVGEFICLTSLFTTMKYYPDDPGIFRERIVRYARTIPKAEGSTIAFVYTQIRKGPQSFEYRDVAEFVVDTETQTVTERLLDPSFDPRATAHRSPVVRGSRPGSYSPLASA